MAGHQQTLEFRGRIVGGIGQYSKMVIPGKGSLTDAAPDWPDQLCPGSLNILIDEYPDGFKPPQGHAEGAYRLDDQTFRCAFLIPGDCIANNELMYRGKPSPAQVWKAKLDLLNKQTSIDCWVLRRLGSGAGVGIGGNVLEIVSDKHLRSEHGLHDGHIVVLTLFAA